MGKAPDLKSAIQAFHTATNQAFSLADRKMDVHALLEHPAEMDYIETLSDKDTVTFVYQAEDGVFGKDGDSNTENGYQLPSSFQYLFTVGSSTF